MPDRDRPDRPSRSLRPDLAEIEALAALLDAQSEAWDAPPPAGAPRVPDDLTATARAVRAASGPRGLPRRFADRLEEDLMDLAALDRPYADALSPRSPRSTPAATGVGEPLAGSRGRGRPPRRSEPSGREGVRPFSGAGRRGSVVELAGLAAMIALIALVFGQAMDLGGTFTFWRDDPTSSSTPARSIAALADDATVAASATPATAAAAFERGNPGRTGVYDTTGPKERPALLWRHNDPNGDPIEALEPIVAGDRAYVSIQRGRFTAVTDFTLPEGTGGFGSWLLTSAEGVNVAFAHGLTYAASLLSADRESGQVNEVPALVAYDQATYEERWRVEVDFAPNTSPVVAGDTLLVLAQDALIALDAVTGEERWRYAIVDVGTDVAASTNPAVAGDTVVVNEQGGAAGFGRLKAIDIATGEVRWTVDSDEGEFQPPAISDGTVYVLEISPGECCFLGRFWAFDAATGDVVWQIPGAEEASTVAVMSAPVVDADSVYTFELREKAPSIALIARDKRTGDVRWQRDVDINYGSQISLADGILYYTLPDGGVYAARAVDGEELWRVDTGDPTMHRPIPADGYLVVVSRSAVYAFGPAADEAPSDVSGLPDCESPRTLADEPPAGEPALGLVELEENPLGYGVPFGGRMLLADVPEGEAAGDAAVVGIFATLRAMTACARPGSEAELGGFYSDDYFRRFGGVEGKPGGDDTPYPELYPVGTLEVGDLGAPYVLPDKRVGLLAFDPLGDRGTLLVFVERDGAWLIDEVVDVGRDLEVWRQG